VLSCICLSIVSRALSACHVNAVSWHLSPCLHQTRGGGLGSRPKKMYGERLGDGVEYHLMSPTPVVKYHLRRGVGLIKFLENGTRPQPPTSLMVLDPSTPPLRLIYAHTHIYTLTRTHTHTHIHTGVEAPCSHLETPLLCAHTCLHTHAHTHTHTHTYTGVGANGAHTARRVSHHPRSRPFSQLFRVRDFSCVR